MNELEAHEIQALIKHHCQALINAIDDGGIRPAQWTVLHATGIRINELIVALNEKGK